MTGAELADELSVIAAAYRSDARVAWQLARLVSANMAAILAALRSERPAADEGAVERAYREGYSDCWYMSVPTDDPVDEALLAADWRDSDARAALAAAQEG